MVDGESARPTRPKWGYAIGFKEVDGYLVEDWDTVRLVELQYPSQDRLVADHKRQSRLRRQMMR